MPIAIGGNRPQPTAIEIDPKLDMNYPADDRPRLRQMALALAGLDLVAALAGWSRLHAECLGRPAGDAGVLWTADYLAVLVFAPLLALLFWRLYRLAANGREGWRTPVFLFALYLLGAGMGLHEPSNRWTQTLASDLSPALRAAFDYTDNRLGHWVFWGGFVLVIWAVALAQLRSPLKQAMSAGWTALMVLLSLPQVLVMVTNLWKEHTGVDVAVIVLAAGVPLLAWGARHRGLRLRRLPALLVPCLTFLSAVAVTLWLWWR